MTDSSKLSETKKAIDNITAALNKIKENIKLQSGWQEDAWGYYNPSTSWATSLDKDIDQEPLEEWEKELLGVNKPISKSKKKTNSNDLPQALGKDTGFEFKANCGKWHFVHPSNIVKSKNGQAWMKTDAQTDCHQTNRWYPVFSSENAKSIKQEIYNNQNSLSESKKFWFWNYNYNQISQVPSTKTIKLDSGRYWHYNSSEMYWAICLSLGEINHLTEKILQEAQDTIHPNAFSTHTLYDITFCTNKPQFNIETGGVENGFKVESYTIETLQNFAEDEDKSWSNVYSTFQSHGEKLLKDLELASKTGNSKHYNKILKVLELFEESFKKAEKKQTKSTLDKGQLAIVEFNKASDHFRYLVKNIEGSWL